MRLSKVLQLPELKSRGIVLIGTWKTGDREFAVLAHRREKIFPIPRLYHLVEISEKNPDPEIFQPEIDTILRRFRHFDAAPPSNPHKK